MKALVYTGPNSLEMRDLPDPSPAAGEVLVRVDSAGICGSDMHAYLGHDGRRPPPLILGHEAAGTVRDGPGAGRRVTINPLVTCGTCPACRTGRENLCPNRQIISMMPRQGAFAEQLAMPEGNLIEIPVGVPTEKAALAEPIACGWHAVRLAREASKRPIEDSVCLSIGGGAIGLGAALSFIAQGAKEVWLAETNPVRRAVVEKIEGIRTFDPTTDKAPEAQLVVDGVGFDATRALASAAVAGGGVISHIGLGSATGGLDIRRMTLWEVTFIGTYTYTMQDFRETAAAIFDGSLGALDWIEVRALADGAEAFADIKAGVAAAPKIVLAP